VGIPTVSPYRFANDAANPVRRLGEGDYRTGLIRAIAAARSLGCREVRSTLAAHDARIAPTWPDEVRAATDFLRSLRLALREYGVRVNLENHANLTTFELLRLIEEVGDDVVGVCLDTGNLVRQLEDPHRAVRRIAPYVHLTHAKDAVLVFTPRGLAWQARPCGRGLLRWEEIIAALLPYAPDLTLAIEDEPPIHELPIFDPTFIECHPDLTPVELAEVVRLTCYCHEQITQGEFAEPREYEARLWKEQGNSRLEASAAHLRSVLAAPKARR
jgi:sugar phosphate isomerase/epimerase